MAHSHILITFAPILSTQLLTHMTNRVLYIVFVWMIALGMKAQTDKADADQLIYQMLTSSSQTEDWHPAMIIQNDNLKETSEKGIYIVSGDSFQIKSLRSDFYVIKKEDSWVPLNDGRYPLETMVNLLMNRINDNSHPLKLRHHQYGGHKPRFTIPMQNLFNLLAPNMQLYCSVTYIDEHEIRAILVFHQQKLNFIHMLELKVDTRKLTDATSTISGDLYTNIPQGNINNIFKEKNTKNNE